MSFIIKSVELSNIRSHDHLIFEPEASGVTSIMGYNGVGKSTIVDAIAWTLFGTKIGGAKNKDVMRDGVEYAKDQFYARVILEADGQEVLVERKFVSKTGTVEANVYAILNTDEVNALYSDDAAGPEGLLQEDQEAGIDQQGRREEGSEDEETELIAFGDYVLNRLAGPGPSHAVSYIKERLRMDDKGFLSSVLIQQKQVDQLISASAKERASVIEDLTGITAITEALSDARKEHGELKKAATFSHADEDEIKEVESRVYEINQEIVSSEDSVARLREKVTALRNEGTEYAKRVTTAQSNYEKLGALNARLETARHRLEDKKVQAEELMTERKEKKNALGEMTSADSAKAVIAERDKARKFYEQETAKLTAINSERERLSRQIKEAQEFVSSVCGDDENPSVLAEEIQKVTKALAEKISESRSQVASLNSQNTSMRNAITVLTDDDGHCPTCLQSVENTDAAVSKLRESISDNDGQVESLQSQLEADLGEMSGHEDRVSELKEAVRIKEQLSSDEARLRSSHDEKEFASGVIRELKDSLKALEKKAESASNIVYQLEEYQKVLKKAQDAAQAVNTLNLEIEDLKDEINGIPSVSKDKLLRAQKALESKREQYQKFDKERIQKESEEKLFKQQKRSEEDKLRRLREEFNNHRKLMESVSIASGAMKILEEFRRQRIDSSVPVIENYASDFLSRFTDGKFIKLNMDNKFNASVMLADGTVRSVGALSGGELSAAAIALRLAVSMILGGGGERQSIILDEVLVSMDEERASAIMHTIKDTARGQLIFIAHNDSVNAIADKVFELGREQADNSWNASVSLIDKDLFADALKEALEETGFLDTMVPSARSIAEMIPDLSDRLPDFDFQMDENLLSKEFIESIKIHPDVYREVFSRHVNSNAKI